MSAEAIRVLVIESDPGDALVLKDSLSALDGHRFEIHWADSMGSARQVIEGAEPDIVLLDLALDDSVGLVTLTRFTSRYPAFPVIVLTGLDDEAVALEAVRRGAEDYLVKGQIEPAAIARAVRHAIERTRIRLRLDRANEELRRANARLEDLAIRDPLTGLLNRRGLERVLSREVERARRTGAPLQALILDLDDFKGINDSFGHAAGDFVLRMVAVRMELAIRATDHVTRLGGDEFLVLLPETTFEEGAKVAEKVRRAIAEHPVTVGAQTSVTITASIGAIAPGPGTLTIGSLLRQAESALRASKRAGKNRVHLDAASVARAGSGEILAAIERGAAFRVRAHPVVRLEDGSVAAMELEFRMELDGRDVACDPPFVAGTKELRRRLDAERLRHAMAVSAAVPRGTGIHVALSPHGLVNAEVQRCIGELAAARAGAPLAMQVEERELAPDPAAFSGAAAALRESGAAFALADIDPGRSSLAAMAILAPELVKFDLAGPSLADVSADPPRWLERMVRAVSALDTTIVATGIASGPVRERARVLGMAWGQGPFMAEPLGLP